MNRWLIHYKKSARPFFDFFKSSNATRTLQPGRGDFEGLKSASGVSEPKDFLLIRYRTTMPSKELKCEFCDKTFRKNELARHTKAKHTVELAQYLLEEYINNPQYNSLQRYANCLNPKNNAIYSKLYEGGCYYFGANPMFFDEEDSYGSYIKSDENMKIHNEYLTELVGSISLLDFLKVNRILQVKSEEVRKIESDKKETDKQNKLLKEEVETLKHRITYLQEVVNDFKEATECSITIGQMKEEIKSLKNMSNHFQQEAEHYKLKLEQLKESNSQTIDEIKEEHNKSKKTLNDQMDILAELNNKQKIQLESFNTKMESTVNTRVEKEKNKMKEKIDKLKDEKEELEEQIDTLTRENRRLKKASKKSKSSDSDSE
jgi:hypothetical protein